MNFFSSLLLLFLFLFLFFPLIASRNTCSISMCMTSNFEIRFPFYLETSSINCYYPGFRVRCTVNALGTSLDLPYSGEFLIRDINYQTQEIKIYDPKSCLAKRLIPFNISHSVFKAPYYVNFTFFTCPTNLVNSKYKVIDCLSNSKNTTLATTSLHLATNMSSCEIIGTFKVPVSKPGPYNDDIVSHVVNHDILLTWDRPNCKKCEARGALCSFNDDHNQVVCSDFFDDPWTGKDTAPQTARIVALSITIPVFFLVFFCLFLRNAKQPRDNTTEEIITTQPPVVIPPTGLDDSTIATYPQVTLGQSKRIPGSSDGTCVICLSEFCAKEVIRVIPECKHCFHTTCIDEWLRIKGTCPVCRNSPLP